MEVRADGLAGQRRPGQRRGGQHHGDAEAGRYAGRLDLRHHAAGAHPGPAGSADVHAREVTFAVHLGDAGAARAGRVAGPERVDVGEQHQQVGVDERGDERGEAVVVAEPDLLGGHRVVLVDDRHGPQVEQLAQRPVRVAVVRAPGHVVHREQDLPDGAAVPGERGRVPSDQQALADAGGGLLGGQVARAPGQPQRGEPGGDRAGGDQHHLASGGGQLAERVDERVDAGVVQAAGRGGQRGRTDLDDDPAGRGDCFTHPTILRAAVCDAAARSHIVAARDT